MMWLLMMGLAQAAPPIRETGSLGVGLGFGLTVSGFDVKYWLSDAFAVQGIAGFGYYDNFGVVSVGFDVDFLYEFEELVAEGPVQVAWHAGFGGVLSGQRLGANGVVGLEFIFDDVPLEVVLDIRPSIGLYAVGDDDGKGRAGLWISPINTGAHIRYYF